MKLLGIRPVTPSLFLPHPLGFSPTVYNRAFFAAFWGGCWCSPPLFVVLLLTRAIFRAAFDPTSASTRSQLNRSCSNRPLLVVKRLVVARILCAWVWIFLLAMSRVAPVQGAFQNEFKVIETAFRSPATSAFLSWRSQCESMSPLFVLCSTAVALWAYLCNVCVLTS